MNRKHLLIGMWMILTWTASTSSIVMEQDAHLQHAHDGRTPVIALVELYSPPLNSKIKTSLYRNPTQTSRILT
jgi:hypothetical protein